MSNISEISSSPKDDETGEGEDSKFTAKVGPTKTNL